MQLPDTRIALSGLARGGGGGDQSSSPFGTLGAMMKIKEQQSIMQQRQLEAEQQQREMEDDLETRAALQQHARPDDAIDSLWKSGRSTAASKLAQSVYAERKAKSDAYAAQIDNHSKRLAQAAQIAQGVNDDASLATARPAIVALVEPIYGQAINDYIPTRYDKDKMKQLIAAGTTRATQLDAEHSATMEFQDAWAKGLQPDPKTGTWSPGGQAVRQGYRNGLSNVLSIANNAQQWDYYRSLAHQQGAPDDVVKEFGPWEGDGKTSRERARALGLTGVQEGTIANAERRAETAEDREERLAKGGGAKGGLTRTQQWNVADTQEKENEETEKWARTTYEQDLKETVPRESRPFVIGPDGKPTSKRMEIPFGVDRLTPEHQKEFATRKLRTENKARTRAGYPTIEDEAKAAAARGDATAYAAIAQAYTALTVVGKLEDLVKPPAGYTAGAPAAPVPSSAPVSRPNSGGRGGGPAGTPFSMAPVPRPTAGAPMSAIDRQKRAKQILQQKATATDPQQIAALDQELRSMLR